MQMLYVGAVKDELSFVDLAMADFVEHPERMTFTLGEVEPGCLFAVRWGFGGGSIMVFRLEDYNQPRVYQDLMK